MAAKLFYRNAGVLRAITKLFFRDPAGGGTLRTVSKAFYRDGGVLRQVFAIDDPAPTDASFNDFTVSQSSGFGSAAAGYRVNTSGVAQSRRKNVYATLETWLLSGASSDYEVQATGGGDNPEEIVGTTGSWINCSLSPEWYIDSVGDRISVQLLLQVRPAGGGAVIDSWTITLNSERF